jgi:hypothetical protein
MLALSKKSRLTAETYFNAHRIAKEWVRFLTQRD